MNEYSIIESVPSCVWVNEIDERIDSSYYRSSSLLDLKKIKKFKSTQKILDFFDVSKLSGFEYTDYFTSGNLKNGTVIALTSQNIRENQINYDNVIKIPYDIHNYLERSKIISGDILLSYTGQYRRACVAPENKELHLGPNICRLRAVREIDTHFITTFLNSKYGQSILDREKTVSAQPTINMSRIRDILIPIPYPQIQKYIGDKVRKAEQLIAEAKIFKKAAEEILINELDINKLNETLSIHTKKYSWTKSRELSDRIDCEYYKTEFVLNNEHIKNLNAQGIGIRKLKDIILNGSYGTLPSSSDYGKGQVELLRSTNVKEFLIDGNDVIKVPEVYYKDKVKVCNGDILLEIKGNCYTGAIAENIKNKTIVNGSIFKFSVKEEFDNYYILGYLLSQSGQLQKKQNLANSIISYLSIECINNLVIPVLIKEKQVIIGDKYRKYVHYIIESKELIQQAKQDVEDLIECNFDMSQIK